MDDSDRILHEPQTHWTIEVMLPEHPERLVYFAFFVLRLLSKEFRGAAIWIVETGIGSWPIEDIGIELIASLGMRIPKPVPNPLPAIEFQSEELLSAAGFLIQLMTFAWDGYVFLNAEDITMFKSHDGYVHIKTNNEELYEILFKKLNEGKWSPKSLPRQ